MRAAIWTCGQMTVLARQTKWKWMELLQNTKVKSRP